MLTLEDLKDVVEHSRYDRKEYKGVGNRAIFVQNLVERFRDGFNSDC